jgi:hypothetical protein
VAFLEKTRQDKTRQIQMAYLHAVIDQWSLDSESVALAEKHVFFSFVFGKLFSIYMQSPK